MNERPAPKQPFKAQFRDVPEPKMMGIGPLVVQIITVGLIALAIGFVFGNRARQPRDTQELKDRLATVEQKADAVSEKADSAGRDE